MRACVRGISARITEHQRQSTTVCVAAALPLEQTAAAAIANDVESASLAAAASLSSGLSAMRTSAAEVMGAGKRQRDRQKRRRPAAPLGCGGWMSALALGLALLISWPSGEWGSDWWTRFALTLSWRN